MIEFSLFEFDRSNGYVAVCGVTTTNSWHIRHLFYLEYKHRLLLELFFIRII